MTQSDVIAMMCLLRPHRSEFRKLRIGTCGDGGYVLPDDLDGISAVLSLGTGEESSFDYHFAERGMPVYQYDPTIDKAPLQHDNCHFHRIGWAAEDGPQCLSLGRMIETHGMSNDTDAILKFDTEGAEWQCFTTIKSTHLRHFRIIVCELHGLQGIQDQGFADMFVRTMNTLTEFHTVVHLHANNCCGMSLIEGVPVPKVVELTLLRNDRSGFTASTEPIPGPLDFPSMDDRPDLVLTPFS